MAKRQLSLGAFGFAKMVNHRGKLTEVSIPTSIGGALRVWVLSQAVLGKKRTCDTH